MKRINGCLLIVVLLLLASCAKAETTKSGTIYAFNTTIEISISGYDNVNDIYQQVLDIIDLYSNLCDNFESHNLNNIYTINHTSEFLEIDSRLVTLLNQVKNYEMITDGHYNYFLGAITDLYREVIATKDTTKLNQIPELLTDIKESCLIIDGNRVKIEGNAKIDLGGIAKGYALLKVVELLKRNQITHYLINGGYSSIVLGSKNGQAYKVGLKYDETKVLALKDTSIGTSSIHEQSVTIDGVLYHHIIDPYTGSCANLYSSIYLVGDDPALLDALTTACFSMEEIEIKNLCNKYNIKYLVYQNDNLAFSNY